MRSPIRRSKSRDQAGSVLLEALIAILIFSMGILAIVGMQTTAVKAASDAKYRSDASLLANELIGEMWGTDRIGANLQTSFQTGGARYNIWLNNIVNNNILPGVAATPPTVVIDPATGTVTVQVFWKLPSETAAAAAHNFTVIAQIK